MRSAAATRVLALFRFLCFSGLPPLFGTRGASVAWETNCFSVGKRLKSGPYSLSTTSTVSTPIASICVTSTPLIRCLTLAVIPSSIYLSEHNCPGWPIRGICPRGALQEPHQCSIAFLEPCYKRGIRTNVKRALAAVAFLRSITRGRPQVTGYSIRGGPVAKLQPDFRTTIWETSPKCELPEKHYLCCAYAIVDGVMSGRTPENLSAVAR